MNDYVYEKVKTLYPVATAIKARKDGEFLILSNESGDIQFLNDVALEIYHLFNGQNNIESIVSSIYDLYDVDMKELEEDVVGLVRDLQWKHLIKLKRHVKRAT